MSDQLPLFYWVLIPPSGSTEKMAFVVNALDNYSFTPFADFATKFHKEPQSAPDAMTKAQWSHGYVDWNLRQINVMDLLADGSIRTHNPVTANIPRCYWTVEANTEPGIVLQYVMDNNGVIDFTNDAVNASIFDVSQPHDKTLINEALRDRGFHGTLRAGPRVDTMTGVDVDKPQFTPLQIPKEEHLLVIDIKGRNDAVLILRRLIVQNTFLMFGSDEVSIHGGPIDYLDGQTSQSKIILTH